MECLTCSISRRAFLGSPLSLAGAPAKIVHIEIRTRSISSALEKLDLARRLAGTGVADSVMASGTSPRRFAAHFRFGSTPLTWRHGNYGESIRIEGSYLWNPLQLARDFSLAHQLVDAALLSLQTASRVRFEGDGYRV